MEEALGEKNILSFFLGTGALLGQKHSLDVGQNSTLCDGHASKKFVELLIIPAQQTYYS